MKNLFQAFEHKGLLSFTLLGECKREGCQVFIPSYHLTLPTIHNAPGVGTHEHRILTIWPSITYPHTPLDINNILRSLKFELISCAKIGNISVRGLGACITSCSFTKPSLDLFYKEAQVTTQVCGTCLRNALPFSSVEPQKNFSCTLFSHWKL